MAILDRIRTARDETFAARVSMILMKVAIDVANEDGGTTNHANRLAFAAKVIKAEVNNKAVGAACISNNGTMQTTIDADPSLLGSNIPDGDIEFVLGGLYNNLANAYAAT